MSTGWQCLDHCVLHLSTSCLRSDRSNMADEVDVDIEGDEFDASVCDLGENRLLQDQFVQSAWKTKTGISPWKLDSSISVENRELIENMLLEEQYYLTGQGIPQNAWPTVSSSKPKAKQSPSKPSGTGASSRWSQQEKRFFEEGLTQFGRRWTKIAKLVGSRTVLQVKSYARQYFKQKGKTDLEAMVPLIVHEAKIHLPQPSSSSILPSALVNAVRIEKLSDDEDEEVDITDDLSDEGISPKKPQVEDKLESYVAAHDVEAEMDSQTDRFSRQERSLKKSEGGKAENHSERALKEDGSSHVDSAPAHWSEGARLKEDGEDVSISLNKPQLGEGRSWSESSEGRSGPEGAYSETAGSDNGVGKSPTDGADEYQEEEEEEEREEEDEELNAPEQEIHLDVESITDDEKQAIPEFFEGRPSKTPDRYLKIRNYILDQWMKSKPKYLNKTSVRPGLKNCGDVNCIGRVHTYLELIGAINFNCEQAVYNRPRVIDRSRHKEGKDASEAYQLAQRLQSMRTRKRRVRDLLGNWCDSRDLEGQTYEHLSAGELALRREEMKRQPKPCKIARHKESFDPFQLIMCKSFGEDVKEPFRVMVCSEALLIMDMHAHVSRGEVIGLLGGTFNQKDKVLKISVAEPCNSVSTGMQCEMDPLSQTHACEALSMLGYSVVGWYHSHPTFHPNPSLRDIHTQDQFQSYFSRGGAPFIGMIVSPYNPSNASPHSQTTCLLVKEHQESSGCQKLPYRFDFLPSQDIPDWEQLMKRSQWIIRKYSQAHGIVHMDRFFRRDSHLTCLEKMLSSLARYLEPLPDDEGDPFLTQIQALFQSDFIPKQVDEHQEEEDGKNFDSPCDHDQPNSTEHPGRGLESIGSGSGAEWEVESPPQTANSGTESSPVLHLGSVLLTGHDYLL
ncbi:histone H2A deubiquitinase MYSM1 isoform X2 [Gadus chalcogrammus]|uniref:histone H2A deubiquitinase MYSM1 isoform X2 n=1 Tax=Gadus chalcogrammus TaxID=1042646 RepID=UPI0024C4A9C2|nr:histone H2A deubiquitinase MYSM1 isoform X2 [Gadus chalcogrammus]